MLNDEAHHCYRGQPDGEEADRRRTSGGQGARTKKRASGSRGLQAVADQVGVKPSTTSRPRPFFLTGSGYPEGYDLPVGRQRLLADRRHRVRHRQGAADAGGRRRRSDARSTYLRPVGPHPATSSRSDAAKDDARRTAPTCPRSSKARSAASTDYEKALRALGDRSAAQHGETPPVFIVVCTNTTVSQARLRLGRRREQVVDDDEVVARSPASSPLLQQRRRRAGRSRGRARILVDSAQLESGDGMTDGLQEGRRARDRGVQGGVPRAASRARTPTTIYRRRPPARGDEHRRQAGQARRAGALRGLRLDAHRGLGRQHRHPHPRCPGLRHPAALRAGRRPRSSPSLVRGRTSRGSSTPEYAERRTASRSRSSPRSTSRQRQDHAESPRPLPSPIAPRPRSPSRG